MRKLTDHIVSGDQAVQLEVTVADGPGPGGANHRYEISGFSTEMNPSELKGLAQLRTDILFQNGAIREVGVNGITQEALLAIVIDRLSGFQTGPYACRENAHARDHCEEALAWLQKRTAERIKRGVEGTMKA